jgi:hypothetical protein
LGFLILAGRIIGAGARPYQSPIRSSLRQICTPRFLFAGMTG